MIRKEEVFKIGVLGKPHGIKGEISFAFTDDAFDRTEECDYLVLLLDGILVPFFMEEYRFRSDNSALVKFEGIETSEQARRLSNVEVYFPLKYVEEGDEMASWEFFVGFRVHDVHHGDLGCITGVNDSTMNVLFMIEKNGKEILLPAHEEFILGIDRDAKVLDVEVPDGLLD